MSEIETGKEFAKFLGEKGTVDEKGVTTLTLKNYRDFLTSQGLSKEAIEKAAAVEEEVTSGLYRYNAEKVAEQVKTLIDAGKKEEAKDVEVITRITTPNGSRRMRTEAYRSYGVPGTNERSEKTVIAHDDIKEDRSINKDLCAKFEDDLKKLFGI